MRVEGHGFLKVGIFSDPEVLFLVVSHFLWPIDHPWELFWALALDHQIVAAVGCAEPFQHVQGLVQVLLCRDDPNHTDPEAGFVWFFWDFPRDIYRVGYHPRLFRWNTVISHSYVGNV